MRVYEAAKKYEMSSNDFIETINKLGIDKNSIFNTLDDKEVEKVENYFKMKKDKPVVKVAKIIKKVNKTDDEKTKEIVKEKMVFDNSKSSGPFKPKVSIIRKGSDHNNKNEDDKLDLDSKNKKKFDKKQNNDKKFKNPNKNFKDNRNFKDKDEDDNNYKKDNKFSKNNKVKKEDKSKSDIPMSDAPIQGKSKNGKYKKSQTKKKYTHEKKEKEEKELRTDFRKNDKKKKKSKTKDKVLKDEIIRLDGNDSLGMIKMGEEIGVKELAEKLGIQATKIIQKFFMEGKMININAILSFEEAEAIAMEYDVIVEKEEVEDISYGEKYNLEITDKIEELKQRAPIITIMGHVDHGKTSLLDALRHTNVIDTEAGGITQSIGAYQVNWNGSLITFIDTPGHEAFTEMRVRGTNLTDIAILVVAADDGVKPQTIEAISHAKAANVPIIVAINKIDKVGANPMKVKQELTEQGLVPTEWGGETDFIEISAKEKINLDELLETIILTAELLELKANPKKRAKAIIIESRLDTSLGPVADILIQEGELKKNDIFVVGESYGKVRKMVDYKGSEISKAYPSQPVEIIGFSNVPEAGDVLYCVNNEKQAKKIVEDYINTKKEQELNKKKHISLESLSQELENQQVKELKCILRTDTMGSAEALKESLLKLNTSEVGINIIQTNTGAITEGDIMLAEASNAIIIGFNVRPTTVAKNQAEKSQVEIRTYNIIYQVIEEMEAALKGMLAPKYKEIYLGRMEVKQVFKISNVGNIAGTLVVDGKITTKSSIRLIRDGIIVHTGEITSLKRYKDDVKEATLGQECGIGIKDYSDIKQGDIIESFYLEEISR